EGDGVRGLVRAPQVGPGEDRGRDPDDGAARRAELAGVFRAAAARAGFLRFFSILRASLDGLQRSHESCRRLREGGAPLVGSTPIVRQGSGGIFETRDCLLGGFKRGDVSIDVENLDRPADSVGSARKEEEASRPKRPLVGVLERTIPARINVPHSCVASDRIRPPHTYLLRLFRSLVPEYAQQTFRLLSPHPRCADHTCPSDT